MTRERTQVVLNLGMALLLVTAVAGVFLVVTGTRPSSPQPRSPTIDVPPAPDLPAGSTVMTSEIGEDTVHVSGWIHSSEDVDVVTLAAPPPPVEVRNLVVAGDGVPVASDRPTTGRSMAVRLGSAAQLVYVSYDLVGAVDRVGTVDGRALASPTYLAAEVPGAAGPVRLTVTGRDILNVACSPPDQPTEPRPCGRRDGDGWAVTLAASEHDNQVSAQLDHPTQASSD